MEPKDIDLIDFGTGVIAICIVAANFAITPLFAIPAFGAWFGIKTLRRSKSFETWVDRVSSVHPVLDNTMPLLLPPPQYDQGQEIELSALPMNTRRKDNVGFLDRVTQVQGSTNITPITRSNQRDGTTRKLSAINTEPEVKKTTAENMNEALARMPALLPYNHAKIPEPPTPTSVLVGYDSMQRKFIWADFGKYSGDTFHVFVAGQIGAGKDSMLRLWFTQLTQNNDPEDVQFIIIDSKGEWITPSLKDSSHMFVPPVGGFNLKIEKGSTGKRKLVDLANEAVEDALIDAIDMLQARADEFQKVGATNIQAYERKTGKKLPLLFIIATDVGTNLEGILEQLIKFIVLKGRSLGVRAIISLQSASGESTSWRSNMSMVLSGFQGQDSADKPNLGIPIKAMKYRPSELPDVGIPENRGLFVVRKGIYQYVVRGAFLPDYVFEEYCERELPRKTDFNPNELLGSMLLTYDAPKQTSLAQQIAVVAPKRTLNKDQSLQAAKWSVEGIAPSNITKMLGFTSAVRYNEMMPIVSAIHKAVLIKQALLRGRG